MHRIVTLFTAALLLSIPALASAEGALYLERFDGLQEAGVANAQYFVYETTGTMVHSGRGVGAFGAGEYAELAEGWYWVEVGHQRSEHNLQRVFVADGQTTVLPSGWVAVTTVHPDEQPSVGCAGWNAELSIYTLDGGGEQHLIATNRAALAEDFGMVQVPVGTYRAFFHGLPMEIEVRAGDVYSVPTGFALPTTTARQQIATVPNGRNAVTLCTDGALHTLAGTFYQSQPAANNRYRQVWEEVTIPAENESGYFSVRPEPVANRYHGEGSVPADFVPTFDALEIYRSNGVRGSGTASGIPDLEIGL